MNYKEFFYDNAADMFCVSDETGLLQDLNPSWEKVLGWSLDEIMSRPFIEFVHPEDVVRTLEIFAQIFKGHEVNQFDNRYLHKDGTYRVISWKARLIPNQKLFAAVGRENGAYWRDIKLMEQTQSVGKIGGWEVDHVNFKMYWSRQTHLIHGTDPETFVPSFETAFDFYHPESRQELIRAYAKLVDDGIPYAGEYRILNTRGEVIWVHVVGMCEKEGDRVLKTYGTFRDITIYKKTTLQLQQMNERLEFILESANLGSWNWDLVNNSYSVDQRWCELLGLDIDKVQVDFSLWDSLLHPDDREAVYRSIDSYIKGNETEFEHVYRMKHTSGRWVWILDRGRIAQVDEYGSPTLFTGIHFDITKQKEAEMMAIVASQAKSEFLANMSHEIRTPMNAIVGMADLLSETHLDQTQKDFLKNLQRASDVLLNLINGILDISKIEAGYFTLNEDRFDIFMSTHKVVDLFKARALLKKVDLVCSIVPSLPAIVRGDSNRFEQVLINIISNAIKFTDRGSVIVSVQENHLENRKGNLLITVQDTGPGIAEDQIPKLFDRFYQADSSTTKKYEGTGLGLNISKKIIDFMGGEIWMKSELKVGTTVYVTFQFKFEENQYTSHYPNQSLTKTKSGDFKKNILIVDDNEDNRLIVQTFLKDVPANIFLVENGALAVDVFKDKKIDLILMDMQMPILDGYQATRQIREIEKIEKREKTPILALTAYALQEDIKKSIEAGCDDHISKPVKKKDLINKIGTILDR